MEILEAIKSVAKDGTDFKEIEGLIKGLNPISGLTSNEQAFELIRATPLLSSAYDQHERASNDKTLENFKSGKMEETIKAREEALRQTLNPKESDSDKKLREMQDTINGMAADKLLSTLKTDLAKKAKEIDFDPIKAMDYAVYGEKASERMEADAKWMNAEIADRVGKELKEKYSGNTPPKVNLTAGLETLSDSDLYARAVADPTQKPAVLAEIARRSRPKK